MRQSSLQCFVSVLVPIVFLFSGCAKPTGSVTGTVTLDGEVYNKSAIMLVDTSTGQAGGMDINEDGSFDIQELPLGTYTAYLAPKSLPADAEAAPVKIDQQVPGKYWGESTSDIKIEVKAGINEADVPLKTE